MARRENTAQGLLTQFTCGPGPAFINTGTALHGAARCTVRRFDEQLDGVVIVFRLTSNLGRVGSSIRTHGHDLKQSVGQKFSSIRSSIRNQFGGRQYDLNDEADRARFADDNLQARSNTYQRSVTFAETRMDHPGANASVTATGEINKADAINLLADAYDQLIGNRVLNSDLPKFHQELLACQKHMLQTEWDALGNFAAERDISNYFATVASVLEKLEG